MKEGLNHRTLLSGVHGTFVFASRDAFEVDHAQVQALLQPDAVHDADHLEGQHVLPQVLSHLTHRFIRPLGIIPAVWGHPDGLGSSLLSGVWGHPDSLGSGVIVTVWGQGSS